MGPVKIGIIGAGVSGDLANK